MVYDLIFSLLKNIVQKIVFRKSQRVLSKVECLAVYDRVLLFCTKFSYKITQTQ